MCQSNKNSSRLRKNFKKFTCNICRRRDLLWDVMHYFSHFLIKTIHQAVYNSWGGVPYLYFYTLLDLSDAICYAVDSVIWECLSILPKRFQVLPILIAQPLCYTIIYQHLNKSAHYWGWLKSRHNITQLHFQAHCPLSPIPPAPNSAEYSYGWCWNTERNRKCGPCWALFWETSFFLFLLFGFDVGFFVSLKNNSFNWSIADLQCCVSFCTAKWIVIRISTLFQILFPI